MEEIIHSLRNILKQAIEHKVDENNLKITLIVKKEVKGPLAEPDEVITMFQMLGGLKEEIPMEINTDNKAQKINIKFQTKEDLNKIRAIINTIWDNTVDLLEEFIAGDLTRLKDIPDY